jgi:hypothetical protein
MEVERRDRAVLCSVQAHSLAEIDSGMTGWGRRARARF